MNFETASKIENAENVVERCDGRNNIESDGSMSVKECNDFWDQRFQRFDDGVSVYLHIEENTDAKEKESDVEQTSPVFSNLDDMKAKLDESYKEIKESKPTNSPNVVKWFEKGGKIEIVEQNGKRVWVYINREGVEVKYVDGYPKFPPETKHPDIGDLNIGEFTGDRNEDKKLYLEALEEEYGLTEIPEGYVLHHDSENGNMQLIKEEYHKEFTHAGGHSKFKEEIEC